MVSKAELLIREAIRLVADPEFTAAINEGFGDVRDPEGIVTDNVFKDAQNSILDWAEDALKEVRDETAGE